MFRYVIPGIISTHVDDDDTKIFLGNLAPILSDEEVKKFVTSFGPLKAFSLVRDITTGFSKGFAFMSYMDPSVSDAACEGLNGKLSPPSNNFACCVENIDNSPAGVMLCGKEVCCQMANVSLTAKPDMQATGTGIIF